MLLVPYLAKIVLGNKEYKTEKDSQDTRSVTAARRKQLLNSSQKILSQRIAAWTIKFEVLESDSVGNNICILIFSKRSKENEGF